jgi:hypothetical protein
MQMSLLLSTCECVHNHDQDSRHFKQYNMCNCMMRLSFSSQPRSYPIPPSLDVSDSICLACVWYAISKEDLARLNPTLKNWMKLTITS